jgi:phytoene desaturase
VKHKRIIVIGAGFSGLSAATHLAKQGYEVTVFEKNSTPGGRARQQKFDGFTFDMGPSWYWMPDVFENYFTSFGKKTEQYYTLERLDPSYRVYFKDKEYLDIPAGVKTLVRLFESIEPGSGKQLTRYLEEARTKYDIALSKFIFKPGLSWLEFGEPGLIVSALRLHIFQSISTYVRKFFRDERLIQLMEFPVLFLGASPAATPALYSLMNYADMSLGTWYPRGGMFSVVEGMTKLAQQMGVNFRFDAQVDELIVTGGKISSVRSKGEVSSCDAIIASADYHHVEQKLIAPQYRSYSEEYWNTRVLAPSSLLFYIGLNKKVKGLEHHTLFFDRDFGVHAKQIYERPQWPTDPQFYVSCASITDPTCAPAGCDALVILIPVASGLDDTDATREMYYGTVMKRLEAATGQPLLDAIVAKRSYAHKDFINDYNSFKGNAYGLANTLRQTAVLKPSLRSKTLNNLYFCGQLTVPGPGVPTALISGQIAATELIKSIESGTG